MPDTFDDKLEQDGDDAANENKIKTNENLDESEIIEDQPVTLKLLFKSITKMPRELVMLLVCQFCGWLAFFTCEIFFTDFVGQVGSFISLLVLIIAYLIESAFFFRDHDHTKNKYERFGTRV